MNQPRDGTPTGKRAPRQRPAQTPPPLARPTRAPGMGAPILTGIAALAFGAVGVVTAVFLGVGLSHVLGLRDGPFDGEEVAVAPPGPTTTPPSTPAESPVPGPRDVPRPARPGPVHRPAPAEPGDESPVEPAPPDSEAEPPREEASDDDGSAEEAPPAGETEEIASAPSSRRDPFEDIRQRQNVLELPPREALGPPPGPTALAKVYVGSPQECELSLFGSDAVLGKGATLVLTRQDDTETDTRTWTARATRPQTIGESEVIGRFAVRDETLTFAWQPGARFVGDAGLRYSLLRVEIGGQSELCALSHPRTIAPLAMDFRHREPHVHVPFPSDLLPNPDVLRFDLSLEGAPAHRMEPRAGLAVGDTSRIKFADRGGRGNLAEIELQIEMREKCVFALRVFAYPAPLKAGSSAPGERTRIDHAWIVKKQNEHKRARGTTERRQRSVSEQLTRTKNQLQRMTAETLRRGGRVPPDFARQGRSLEQRVPELKKEQELIERRMDVIESRAEWLDRLRGLLDTLTADARLHCRIYLELESGTLEVLRTKADSEQARNPTYPESVQD